MNSMAYLSRRKFIEMASLLATGVLIPGQSFSSSDRILKSIPKTDEMLPAIGMGTSRTFDARGNSQLLAQLQQVTQKFFDMGGGMIDSSPMYGSAQAVIGQLLPNIKDVTQLFAATKVWTDGKDEGIRQMESSRQRWGIKKFDLMQIHNLVDWQTHLETLEKMKQAGRLRYIGITTSHGRYHSQLEKILQKHALDFVQLTYNIDNRDTESPLLDIARDKGIAVIANRPYQRGTLFRQVRGKPLPPWADTFDCTSWGQYFLKFVISHPAITCAIPATSKVKHMQDNMQAGRGRLPTAKQRIQMIKYFESL